MHTTPPQPKDTGAGFPQVPDSLDSGGLLLTMQVHAPEFVIEPFLPRGEVTEIVGQHATFKSTIALDACLAVATGRPWGGFPTAQGRAVFITLEDSAETLARRTRAWTRGLDGWERECAEIAIEGHLQYLARDRAQGLVLTETSASGVTTLRAGIPERVARLAAGASLIVLETVSRLHDGPETNEGFRALVRALETIAIGTRAAVVVVHHTAKPKAPRGGDAGAPRHGSSYDGRGGGVLADAARSILKVTRNTERVTLTMAKSTHAGQEGLGIAWTPEKFEPLRCVRLKPAGASRVRAKDDAATDAVQLVAHLESGAFRGTGVVVADFNDARARPAGMSRQRARRAFEFARDSG
jgi:hypothetical protein